MFISISAAFDMHIESHTSYPKYAKFCYRNRSRKQTQYPGSYHWWRRLSNDSANLVYIYDNESSKIYVGTQKTTKKFQNIRRNDKIYFSIDDENFPYKGVKGRSVAKISEDIQKNLPIVEKIMIKYLGTIDHPFAKMGMEITRNGIAVVIELTPKFFSAWDLGKLM